MSTKDLFKNKDALHFSTHPATRVLVKAMHTAATTMPAAIQATITHASSQRIPCECQSITANHHASTHPMRVYLFASFGSVGILAV
jgi:hypothetical protein